MERRGRRATLAAAPVAMTGRSMSSRATVLPSALSSRVTVVVVVTVTSGSSALGVMSEAIRSVTGPTGNWSNRYGCAARQPVTGWLMPPPLGLVATGLVATGLVATGLVATGLVATGLMLAALAPATSLAAAPVSTSWPARLAVTYSSSSPARYSRQSKVSSQVRRR